MRSMPARRMLCKSGRHQTLPVRHQVRHIGQFELTCVGQADVQDGNLVHLHSRQSPLNTIQMHKAPLHKAGSQGPVQGRSR